MNDINLNGVKITKGLPKVRYYSDDRAPTLEETRNLIEYPDRRIKSIIYAMISSGIRIGLGTQITLQNNILDEDALEY